MELEKENHFLKGILENFIDLMHKEEYFEAHEVLEEAWHYLKRAKDPLANLTKGLINSAIAFEHLKRDKINSLKNAKIVIRSFDRHVGLYNQNIREAKLFKVAIDIVHHKRDKI